MVKLLLPATVGGLFLVLAGGLLVGLIPVIVHNAIEASLKMTGPTSEPYKSFFNATSIGVDLYSAFRFYHVLNPEEVQAGGLAQLEEIGPFVYKSLKTYNETVTSWWPNGTFQYRPYEIYEFDPVKSCPTCDPNMILTTPSFALFGLQKIIRYLRSLASGSQEKEELENWLFSLMDLVLWKNIEAEPLFQRRSVNELLFGYEDQLLEKLLGKSGGLIGFNPPSTPELYAATANNEAYTGGKASDSQPSPPKNSNRWMTKYQGKHDLGFWGSEYANTVQGTDGTSFHPFLEKDTVKLVFVDQVPRVVNFTFMQDTELHGVPLWRHRIQPSSLQSRFKNPASKPYYMDFDGWISTPPSEFGKPLNFSTPHFLETDLSVVHLNTTFPNPTFEEYGTYLDLEPLTGATMRAHKRLQINLQLDRLSWTREECVKLGIFDFCGNVTQVFPQFVNVTPTLFPVFWEDVHAEANEHLCNELKDTVLHPLLYAKVFGGLAIAIGCVLVIGAVVVKVLDIRRRKQSEKLAEGHVFYTYDN